MKNLFLILKKQYFNEIKAGTKTVEYREATDYWLNRLTKHYDTVTFQLGYSKDAERLERGITKIELIELQHEFFGSEPKMVFAIHLCDGKKAGSK